jgi:hypothetical protein
MRQECPARLQPTALDLVLVWLCLLGNAITNMSAAELCHAWHICLFDFLKMDSLLGVQELAGCQFVAPGLQCLQCYHLS